MYYSEFHTCINCRHVSAIRVVIFGEVIIDNIIINYKKEPRRGLKHQNLATFLVPSSSNCVNTVDWK
jgi:hypothetical protein